MQNTILDHEFKDTRFEVYDRFQNAADAEYLVSLLQTNNIPHQVEQPKQLADAVITGEGLIPKVFVRVRLEDFKKINQLIEQDTLRLIGENKIDLQEHFLNDFSDQELQEVVEKPDEWNYDTAIIARHLLQARGVEYSDQQIAEQQEVRLAEVRSPRNIKQHWMVLYLLISIGSAYWISFLPLIIGSSMGYYYWRDISTDTNGGRYYTFDQPTRTWGKVILLTSVIVSLLRLLISFFIKPE